MWGRWIALKKGRRLALKEEERTVDLPESKENKTAAKK